MKLDEQNGHVQFLSVWQNSNTNSFVVGLCSWQNISQRSVSLMLMSYIVEQNVLLNILVSQAQLGQMSALNWTNLALTSWKTRQRYPECCLLVVDPPISLNSLAAQ